MYKKKQMSDESIIMPAIADSMGRIIRKIENVTTTPKSRKVKDVISDLIEIGEYDLVGDLRDAIETYNKQVADYNRRVDFNQEVSVALKHFKRNKKWSAAYYATFPRGSIFAHADDYRDVTAAVRAFEYEYRRLMKQSDKQTKRHK